MMGDAAPFQRADIIEASWVIIDPLLEAWNDGTPREHASGDASPDSADALLSRDGRRCLALDKS